MLEVVICSVCYEFVILCFFSSFTSPYVILLKIVLLIPLKYHTGNRSCRQLQYNIITSKPRVHIFHCSRGGRLAALVGVCIVWNLEPLASGGQSGHKLIPHIICQFLYAWGKLWTRTYSTRDQVPVGPIFTRAKIKSRSWSLKNLPSQLNWCVRQGKLKIIYILKFHVLTSKLLWIKNIPVYTVTCQSDKLYTLLRHLQFGLITKQMIVKVLQKINLISFCLKW